MRFAKLTIPKPSLDAQDWVALRAGMIPGYLRVWSGGVDVTDEPVASWPFYDQQAYANGWRPVIDLDGTFLP